MRRKCPRVAAWVATGVAVSFVLAMQWALPGVAAASSLLPASDSLVGIAGGDEDGDGGGGGGPPKPPPFPVDGVLWNDDFEDGSVKGWVVGQTSPFQPRNVADGGPLGAGDSYLRLHSSGDNNQPGSRVVVLNRNRIWTQDLNQRGITRIEFDVLNLNSPTPLQLRFAFYSLGPNGFASTNPVLVPASPRWQHVVMPFSPSAMTNVGTMPWADVLKHFEEVRILSSATPGLRGDPIFADWGLDNIKVVVPEPSSLAVAATAAASALLRRRRRRCA